MRGVTGSYGITTLLAAPASAALVSLATVKDELDIKQNDTSRDQRLQRFINEESAGVARYCNRIFGLATWQDQFRLSRGVLGEGVREENNPLKLARHKVLGPPVIVTGNLHSSKLIDGIASTQGLQPGQPVFGIGVPATAAIARVTPNFIFLTLSATATTVGAQITIGMSVVQTLAGTDTTLIAGTDYELRTGSMLPGDEGPGRLYRLDENGEPITWYGQKITVIYQAGYALPNDEDCQGVQPLPGDLGAACLRLVVMRYHIRGRDPTLMQRDQPGMVGTERYWAGPAHGQTGAYPPDIQDVLDHYRTPVVA